MLYFDPIEEFGAAGKALFSEAPYVDTGADIVVIGPSLGGAQFRFGTWNESSDAQGWFMYDQLPTDLHLPADLQPCDVLDHEALDFINNVMKSTSPGNVAGPLDTLSFSLSNPNWRHAEFIGFLGTNGQIGPTVIEPTGWGGYRPDFDQFNGPVQALVHNHPAYRLNFATGEFNRQTDNVLFDNRYPSSGDWNVLQAIADRYGAATGNSNPAMYLVDPFGVAREFRLSDRASIEGLSVPQRQAGMGLDGREIDVPSTGQCGN
jgi:hypothetical protein